MIATEPTALRYEYYLVSTNNARRVARKTSEPSRPYGRIALTEIVLHKIVLSRWETYFVSDSEEPEETSDAFGRDIFTGKRDHVAPSSVLPIGSRVTDTVNS